MECVDWPICCPEELQLRMRVTIKEISDSSFKYAFPFSPPLPLWAQYAMSIKASIIIKNPRDTERIKRYCV